MNHILKKIVPLLFFALCTGGMKQAPKAAASGHFGLQCSDLLAPPSTILNVSDNKEMLVSSHAELLRKFGLLAAGRKYKQVTFSLADIVSDPFDDDIVLAPANHPYMAGTSPQGLKELNAESFRQLYSFYMLAIEILEYIRPSYLEPDEVNLMPASIELRDIEGDANSINFHIDNGYLGAVASVEGVGPLVGNIINHISLSPFEIALLNSTRRISKYSHLKGTEHSSPESKLTRKFFRIGYYPCHLADCLASQRKIMQAMLR